MSTYNVIQEEIKYLEEHIRVLEHTLNKGSIYLSTPEDRLTKLTFLNFDNQNTQYAKSIIDAENCLYTSLDAAKNRKETLESRLEVVDGILIDMEADNPLGVQVWPTNQ